MISIISMIISLSYNDIIIIILIIIILIMCNIFQQCHLVFKCKTEEIIEDIYFKYYHNKYILQLMYSTLDKMVSI